MPITLRMARNKDGTANTSLNTDYDSDGDFLFSGTGNKKGEIRLQYRPHMPVWQFLREVAMPALNMRHSFVPDTSNVSLVYYHPNPQHEDDDGDSCIIVLDDDEIMNDPVAAYAAALDAPKPKKPTHLDYDNRLKTLGQVFPDGATLEIVVPTHTNAASRLRGNMAPDDRSTCNVCLGESLWPRRGPAVT